MDIIKISDLYFNYSNNIIFKNLNFNIKQGLFYYLTGKNSVGKTTFLKILSGKILAGDIRFENKRITKNNIHILRNNVEYIDSNNIFYAKTVFDELDLLNENDIDGYIKKILLDFDMLDYINVTPSSLNEILRIKLSIIKAIIKKKKVILIDNAFSSLSTKESINIINILKKYALKSSITVIVSSFNSNIIFEFDNIILINDKNINFCDSYIDEDLFNSNSLSLPFVCELSDKLNLYNLVDDDIYDIEELVDKLC